MFYASSVTEPGDLRIWLLPAACIFEARWQELCTRNWLKTTLCRTPLMYVWLCVIGN